VLGECRPFIPQLKGLGFGTFEVVEMADLDLWRGLRKGARWVGGPGSPDLDVPPGADGPRSEGRPG